jgi:O-acetyl-ADP-ribose deacetylase (regulator of RNase III)
MPFQIIRNDITKVSADVIVNTANPHPVIGNGTDSAIYAAAGEKLLLAERMKIGEIARGECAVTPAFGLSAKYIIHTVGPIWEDGNHGEREILHSCYSKSLALAAELKAESIAFPLIATGVYGFPKDEALNIALSEIGKFLLTHEMEVILVVFDKKSFELSAELVHEIDEYIDEHGVGLAREAEYEGLWDDDRRRMMLQRRRRELSDLSSVNLLNIAPEDGIVDGCAYDEGDLLQPGCFQEVIPNAEQDRVPPPGKPYIDYDGKSLDEVLKDADKTFQERLFELIDASGIEKDSYVYKDTFVDRKLFSSIRCKKDYKPTKRTAVALAVSLHLDMPTMQDLLSRAGLALSRSNTFDLIVAYFIEKGNYSFIDIDAALFKYGQPTLGNCEK